jgi:hypothetical protein
MISTDPLLAKKLELLFLRVYSSGMDALFIID